MVSRGKNTPRVAVRGRTQRLGRAIVRDRDEPRRHDPRVADIQRSRLLAAAVRSVDELGWANTTVADIVTRSRISRRTFYETFANCEECLTVVWEDILGALADELAAEDLGGLAWREQVRRGLWTILSFFDREPVLARICVVQALGAGPELLRRREQILARLVAVVDEGRLQGARAGRCTPLTAEGVVGAAFAIVYTRLLKGDRRPLTGLLGDLMGMIVLPYLGSTAASRELTRSAPIAPASTPHQSRVQAARSIPDPLGGAATRLTYRTVRVLEGIAEHPGASNRQAGERAGISDAGQVSKLLARLERLGLLTNSKVRVKGEPNAWALTAKGVAVAQSIRAHASADAFAGAANASAGTPHGASLSTDRGAVPSALKEEEIVR